MEKEGTIVVNNIVNWIKEVINKMFNKNDISKAFNIDISISSEMVDAIKLWSDMYENKAPWLSDDVKSLNLPASIASELARMITIEHKSEITGSTRADFLNNSYKEVKKKLRIQVEYGNATGGMIFKPYVKNNKICVDYVLQGSFVPTAFDSTDRMTGAIFTSQVIKGKFIYTRLESHKFENNSEFIQNKVYVSENSSTLGSEVSIQTVDEWKDINESVLIENVDKPLFAYYKVPFANNIDPKSPLGVSVYSRAVEDIKKADKQYGRLEWEYEASEKAIYADIVALKEAEMSDKSKKYEMPTTKNRLIKKVGIGKDDFYQDYSPDIRDEAFIRGLNKDKQEIEFKCQIAYGTISDPQEIEKSATEIKAGKQRSFATVSDAQKSLQDALEDLIYAMDVLCTLYNLAPAGKYETAYDWDDSIVSDRQSEFAERQQLVTGGVINKWEQRAWYLGETKEQAKANLPKEDDSNIFNHPH